MSFLKGGHYGRLFCLGPIFILVFNRVMFVMSLRSFFLVLSSTSLLLLSASVYAQKKVVPENGNEIALSFAPLVKSAAPAVVNIYTRRVVQRRTVSPLFNDPFFRRYAETYSKLLRLWSARWSRWADYH